ncbi:enoyl-CoA hydratase/isomerase family protein [Nocardia miyunensis]|uniref:enoyl-CoA hydratase/isomerase family protein n=1 Tax=Nocardia miyunensis TaxID=282684 RepID=UPI00082E376E|nr:enoyl-CoA hydratase-related protein [Nocardia miyunensis]
MTFNRPDRLNALSTDTLAEAARAIEAAGADPEIRVVVLTGAGRAFSSGALRRRPHGQGEPGTAAAKALLKLCYRSAPTNVDAAPS